MSSSFAFGVIKREPISEEEFDGRRDDDGFVSAKSTFGDDDQARGGQSLLE